MSHTIAKVFSYVFQPLLMPTYLFSILLFLSPASLLSLYSQEIRFWLLLVIFISTFVIPLVGVFAFRLTKNIESYEMAERDERVVPFVFITVFYAVAAFLMSVRLDINPTINIIMISSAVLVFIGTIITFFWKISIHSIGMAGVAGYLVGLNAISPDPSYFQVVLIWMILTGITMSSRLYLNVHSPSQAYVGSLVGFLVAFLSIVIFVES